MSARANKATARELSAMISNAKFSKNKIQMAFFITLKKIYKCVEENFLNMLPLSSSTQTVILFFMTNNKYFSRYFLILSIIYQIQYKNVNLKPI